MIKRLLCSSMLLILFCIFTVTANAGMVITNDGLAEIAAAVAAGTYVEVDQISVGDSNGTAYTPSASQTALVNELWKAAINKTYINPSNSNQVIFEGIIPKDHSAGWLVAPAVDFTIREVGLWSTSGDLFAVGDFPATIKYQTTDGSGNDIYIQTIIQTSNASTITISVDPSAITATQAYVDAKTAWTTYGYSTLNAAIIAIGATNADLKVNSSVTMSASITVPANIRIVGDKGGLITLGAYNLNFASAPQPDIGNFQLFNQNGAGTVSGLLKANPEWWGGAADNATNSTAAFVSTRNSLSGSATGKMILQKGTYLIDKFTINEKFGLIIEGQTDLYSSNLDYGTTIASRTAGTALIEIDSGNTNLVIRNLNLDGRNQVDAVVNFTNTAGEINDFITLENLNFYNVKNLQSFVKSYILNATYSENAGVVMRNINFQLNSALDPASLGTAIHMENYGAWGWVCEGCWFSGQSKVNSIYLFAGDLHLKDCQFDNNSTASTYDIKMYSSATLTIDNVRSQSDQVFLWINPKTISQGFTSEKPIIIRNLFHHDDPGAPSWSTPPAYSIIHDATNSLVIDGMEGYGVNLTSTPVEVSIKNARSYREDTAVKYDSGLNMLTNSEFETVTTGWSARKSATLSVNTLDGYWSTNSLKVLNGAETYGSAVQAITTVANSVYRLVAYYKAGTDATGALIRASTDIDGGGQLLDSGVLTNKYWTRYDATFTATGTTTYISLMVSDIGTWDLFDRVAVYLEADGSNATHTLGQGDNNYLFRGLSRDLAKEVSLRHDIPKNSFDFRSYEYGVGYLPTYFYTSGLYLVSDGAIQSEIATRTNTVEITSAELLALRVTQITLVPAPGAGYVNEFVSAVLMYDSAATDYTVTAGGDDLAIRYTDGTGTIVSNTIDTAGFIDEPASDGIRIVRPLAGGTLALTANAALVLDNIGANEFTNGTGTMTVKITYRVHATGL